MSDAFSDKAPIEVGDIVKLNAHGCRALDIVERMLEEKIFPDVAARNSERGGTAKRLSWAGSREWMVLEIQGVAENDSSVRHQAFIALLDEFGAKKEGVKPVGVMPKWLVLLRKGKI